MVFRQAGFSAIPPFVPKEYVHVVTPLLIGFWTTVSTICPFLIGDWFSEMLSFRQYVLCGLVFRHDWYLDIPFQSIPIPFVCKVLVGSPDMLGVRRCGTPTCTSFADWFSAVLSFRPIVLCGSLYSDKLASRQYVRRRNVTCGLVSEQVGFSTKYVLCGLVHSHFGFATMCHFFFFCRYHRG